MHRRYCCLSLLLLLLLLLLLFFFCRLVGSYVDAVAALRPKLMEDFGFLYDRVR